MTTFDEDDRQKTTSKPYTARVLATNCLRNFRLIGELQVLHPAPHTRTAQVHMGLGLQQVT